MTKKLSNRIKNFLKEYQKINNNFTNLKGKIILVHFNGWPATQFAQLLITNILSHLGNKKIIAFSDNFFFQRNTVYLKMTFYAKWFLGIFFKIKNFGIYKNFGTEHFLLVKPHKKQINNAKIFTQIFYKKNVFKKTILKLKINNILIGDILYDSFMHHYRKETVEVNESLFINYFEKFIATYFFWLDYFKKNKIATVVNTHSTYLDGLPARIAMCQKVKCFAVSHNKIYYLTKKFIYPYRESEFFKKNFAKLNLNTKKLALKKAKLGIEKRLNGKLGDMIYLTKTPYGPITHQKVLRSSSRKKILIAAHSLSDAPHTRGEGLFLDFYEWLVFLLKLSCKTKYDWYIKCHPNFHEYNDKTVEVIKKLLKKYNHVKWLDPSTSHKQIIKEGINLALTVDGSIGLEYPYFKIPVFNASLINVHINYKFNEHPKNITEYKNIILNFNKYKPHIKTNEILECYFMHNYYYNNNWLIDDYDKVVNYIGGDYRDMNISKKMYSFFESFLNKEKLNQLVPSFINFYLKEEYIFNPNKTNK